MSGVESIEGVERFVNSPGPAAGLVIFNIAASGRRLVDSLAKTRCEILLVGAISGRGDLELAEQGQIALGNPKKHCHERRVRLTLKVGADARERAGACGNRGGDRSHSRPARSPPCVCRSRSRRRRDRCTRP